MMSSSSIDFIWDNSLIVKWAAKLMHRVLQKIPCKGSSWLQKVFILALDEILYTSQTLENRVDDSLRSA